MKEEIINLWQKYHTYLEETKGLIYDDQKEEYVTFNYFMEWLEKGYITTSWM